MRWPPIVLAVLVLHVCSGNGFASFFNLGPEQVVQAGGADILVDGYSVPSYADWNNDGKTDLVVGEGGSGYAGRVHVYLNVGTASNPQF